MSEKQVIMSKVEFDKMEKELDNLRKIVESKSIVKIKDPYLGWTGGYLTTGPAVRYEVEYIFGVDENEVVKALSEELDQARKDRDESYKKISNLELSNHWLKEEKDKWKNLPWYKRLFIK